MNNVAAWVWAAGAATALLGIAGCASGHNDASTSRGKAGPVAVNETGFGQVNIAPLDRGTVWTTDVTQDGLDTCVTATAGPVGGSLCSQHWGEHKRTPQATYAPTTDAPGGAHRILVVIISSPARTVGLIPRPPCRPVAAGGCRKDGQQRPEPVVLGSMRGVHSEIVELSGEPKRIWSLVIEGTMPDGAGPPVEAIYTD